jgi:RNA polymerase sigma factor (sigma-70 family)
MQAEQVSPPATPDIFRVYASLLPRWLYRFGLSPNDGPDVKQEVWLAVCEGTVTLPSDVEKAKLELFKVTRRIAQRLRRHRQNDAQRHVLEPDDYVDDVDEQERATRMLVVLDAFERLSPEHLHLAREYYVEGYTYKEMAERAGIPERRMEKRVWRVSAELQRLCQTDERLHHRKTKNQKSGMLIVPFALDLDSETRAAFCTIWDAEGRPPAFGGAPPPFGTPFNPPVFPNAPILSSLTGFVAVLGVLVLGILLVLVPVGIVALHYFRKPAHLETAQTGLRIPPIHGIAEIKVVDDVVPVYPTAAPSATSIAPALPAKPARVVPMPLDNNADEPSSSPPLERLTGD